MDRNRHFRQLAHRQPVEFVLRKLPTGSVTKTTDLSLASKFDHSVSKIPSFLAASSKDKNWLDILQATPRSV
jgi:hypothetical protein